MTTTAASATMERMSDTELVFDTGLIGFPDSRRYTLAPVGAVDDGVFELAAVDEPGLGFVALAPAPFFPDYAPVVDGDTVTDLELSTAEDALVLVIVTLGARLEDATANLLAPVVVNRHTRRGAQVVLADQDLPLRAAVVRR